MTSRQRRAKDVLRTLVSLAACGVLTAAAATASAQTAKQPEGQLAYAIDSSNGLPYLYGTTLSGGSGSAGTLFRIRTDASGYSLLHSFQYTVDGDSPIGGMILDAATNVLYGVTDGTYPMGGGSRPMTFYSLNASAPNTYDAILQPPDISGAGSNLIEIGGVFYGTAGYNIFSISKTGGFLWTLQIPGAGMSGLTYGVDQNGVAWLYGTSGSGGTNGTGYIFKIHLDGTGYAVMWNFDALNTNHSPANNTYGANPAAALTLVQGILYGTAMGGGTYSYTCSGIAYTAGGYGTLFSIDQNTNAFTLLHTFTGSLDKNNNCNGIIDDGRLPVGQLLQGVNCSGQSVLYGTTVEGGWYADYSLGPAGTYQAQNYGTIYEITVSPFTYQEVRAFAGPPNSVDPVDEGAGPYASLTEDPTTPTIYYGTTSAGGKNKNGTVFAWNACSTVRGSGSKFLWVSDF